MNLQGVITALNDAYDKSPEAVNNDKYREILKKSFICNGTLSLLRSTWANSYGCAAAVMIIDSYVRARKVYSAEISGHSYSVQGYDTNSSNEAMELVVADCLYCVVSAPPLKIIIVFWYCK